MISRLGLRWYEWLVILFLGVALVTFIGTEIAKVMPETGLREIAQRVRGVSMEELVQKMEVGESPYMGSVPYLCVSVPASECRGVTEAVLDAALTKRLLAEAAARKYRVTQPQRLYRPLFEMNPTHHHMTCFIYEEDRKDKD